MKPEKPPIIILTYDIILFIICFLDLKSFHRFKSTCKHFNKILQGSYKHYITCKTRKIITKNNNKISKYLSTVFLPYQNNVYDLLGSLSYPISELLRFIKSLNYSLIMIHNCVDDRMHGICKIYCTHKNITIQIFEARYRYDYLEDKVNLNLNNFLDKLEQYKININIENDPCILYNITATFVNNIPQKIISNRKLNVSKSNINLFGRHTSDNIQNARRITTKIYKYNDDIIMAQKIDTDNGSIHIITNLEYGVVKAEGYGRQKIYMFNILNIEPIYIDNIDKKINNLFENYNIEQILSKDIITFLFNIKHIIADNEEDVYIGQCKISNNKLTYSSPIIY